MLRILSHQDTDQIQALLSRSQLQDEQINRSVREIVDRVRAEGDAALLAYTHKFDRVRLEAKDLRVSREEIDAAYAEADPNYVEALRRAAHNIRRYHEKQVRQTWIHFEPDQALGQMIRPLARVGVYVPGGTAGYPSSVLMNVLPAKVAGVPEIVMVTPPGPDGRVSCTLSLIAADIAGVDRIYKIGGAQAVAALAYGTETIPAVDKIVGPGNIYVANAKRQVFGHVGIDMIAGPSEVLVIADESANPVHVAADLLSQAEHDPYAAALLVTCSRTLAQQVAKEAAAQAETRSRRDILAQSLSKHGAIVVTDTLEQAVALSNRVAPEHLELAVANPFELLGLVENAGAVFLGRHTPEPVGDYYAGPNHVLPTSGTARFFSPLSVDDFVKKTSLIHYTPQALAAAAQDVITLAKGEGLDAHAHAVAVRLQMEEA